MLSKSTRDAVKWAIEQLGGAQSKQEKVNDSDVIIWLPCKSGSHPVTKDDVLQYVSTYKNISIELELKLMYSWLDANKAKRKTKSGVKRFINSWLSRANDKGGSFVWNGEY